MRRPISTSARHLQRGFTLLEIMVGSALALIMVSAAFSFAQTQVKELNFTSERVYMTEVGRTGLNMLTDDIRHAGAGVGYAQDGTFGGLLSGTFTAGGVTFNSNNGTLLNLENSAAVPTDDVGILSARGGYSTIADFANTGSGQLCKGAGIQSGALVMFRSESGNQGTAAILTSVTDTPLCSLGNCIGGCQNFVWTPSSLWTSDPNAWTANYTGGEVSSRLAKSVWFVDASDPAHPGIGALRRAVFDGTVNCTARDYTCGDIVAQNVETLQMVVWRFDSTQGVWANVTGLPLNYPDRLRVDIELVVRARVSDQKAHDPLTLRLEPSVCLPSGCSNADTIERVAFRASVDVMNSGRLAIH